MPTRSLSSFPALRFGFIEAAAGWAPFLLHIVRRVLKDKFRFGSSAELFKEYRLYVACEADEDIPYLARCMGEDSSADRLGLPAQRSVARRPIRQRAQRSGRFHAATAAKNSVRESAAVLRAVTRMEHWSDGVLECWVRKPITPPLQYSITPGGVVRMMANLKRTIQIVLFGLGLLAASSSGGEEVFIGNPGKSLNFFHFDLAIERGFFASLGSMSNCSIPNAMWR